MKLLSLLFRTFAKDFFIEKKTHADNKNRN